MSSSCSVLELFVKVMYADMEAMMWQQFPKSDNL